MTRRYPLQPLLDAAGGISMSKLRETIPMNGRQYRNATELGLLFDQADRWAVRLGFHPYEIWPEMLEDALAGAAKVCDDRDCDTEFFPRTKLHRFCSKKCQQRTLQRTNTRLRYQTDEVYAERKKAMSRAYYGECREYVRSRQQAARTARKDAA